MSRFPRIRATFIVLAIAIVGWLGYGVYNLVTAPEVSRLGIFGTITRTDTVRLGGSFSLIDQNGRRRSDGEFRGQLMLIYFGYTYCPDVCPTSVQIMTEALETLGENGNLVRPIFITVDPARDTVNVMREYAENFHPRLVALTGPENRYRRGYKGIPCVLRQIRGIQLRTGLSRGSQLVHIPDGRGRSLPHPFRPRCNAGGGRGGHPRVPMTLQLEGRVGRPQRQP